MLNEVAYYDNPAKEQAALEKGHALVGRPDLAVVRVSGADRHSWLTSLTTQVLTGLAPGESRELLVLDPNGRIEFWAASIDEGDSVLLVTDADRAQSLADWLRTMQFALRVEVSEADDLDVFATAGTGYSDPEDLPGYIATWDDPWPGVTDGGTEYFRGAKHPGERTPFHLHLVRAEVSDKFIVGWLEADPQNTLAGSLAWEAARIAAWRPTMAEVDDRTIPAELDWLRTAVHIDKGCYRGQESVARVLNLGKPPRRLTFLQIDGSTSELPEPGTPLEFNGRQVGVVTSSARHADMGPVALALVNRNVPVDATFDIDGTAAAQEPIVPQSGKAAASPETRPGVGLNTQLRGRGGNVGGLGMGGR